MAFRTHFLTATAAVCLLAGGAFADGHEGPGADTVVATVNGTEITLGHLIATRAQLPAEYSNLPPNILFDGLLNQLVEQQLLADSLDGQPKRVQIVLDNELRRLRAGEVVAALSEEPVTEEDIQAAYNAQIEGQEPTPEYNASHILVETLEEAEEIKALLDDGGDFSELAQERSTGPSGPNGGNLGWFGPGMMVAPFEEAVVALEVGQVSDPVETQFGWHVVKLNDQREQPLPTLDELRAELESSLQQQRLIDMIETMRTESVVMMGENDSIDPAILNNLELLED